MDTSCCEKCSADLSFTRGKRFLGELICEDCLEEETHYCCECGDRRYTEDTRIAGENYVCESCYDDYYDECCRCGCAVRTEDSEQEDDGYYCDRCYDIAYNGPLRINTYRPRPKFYGDGFFYGIELEVDKGGESLNNASALLEIANADTEHIYVKRDGSLNNGFEVVSHPMSLTYHCKEMPWVKVLDRLWCLGYSSQDTTTCGYHIHADRKSFGETIEEQENHIANILYFVDTHWEQIIQFSRRDIASIERWAARYVNVDGHQKALEYVKKGNEKRYVCVNLQNQATIEFRIFKGTLRYGAFLASLQFVDELCTRVSRMEASLLSKYTWEDFVCDIDPVRKSELIWYLRSMKLLTGASCAQERGAV